MLSPVRLSSVVCLSSVCRLSVCNVRAPYSGGSDFRQYFYGIRYLGHPLTSWHPLKISRRSSQGKPSAGGVKHNRGSQVTILDLSTAISRKRYKIWGKLLLITNRKSHLLMSSCCTSGNCASRVCILTAILKIIPRAQAQRCLVHAIEEIKLNLHCVTSCRPNWNWKRLSSYNPEVDRLFVLHQSSPPLLHSALRGCK